MGMSPAARENKREFDRQWRRTHPEERRRRQRLWKAANRERERQRARLWRENNREKARESVRKWAHANRVAVAAIAALRRARRHAAPGRGINTDEWLAILAASLGLCAYCNHRRRLTLEHIDPLVHGGAHDVDNATAACVSCNMAKSDTPLLLWLTRRASDRRKRTP